MALVPQASGSEALGFWARRLASSTQRLVRRRSPRSASANSLTAQLVVSERLRPDSLGNGLILGCYEVLRPQHTPRASKTKNVGNWQLHLGGAYYAIGDFGRAAELLRRSVEVTDRGAGTPQ